MLFSLILLTIAGFRFQSPMITTLFSLGRNIFGFFKLVLIFSGDRRLLLTNLERITLDGASIYIRKSNNIDLQAHK